MTRRGTAEATFVVAAACVGVDGERKGDESTSANWGDLAGEKSGRGDVLIPGVFRVGEEGCIRRGESPKKGDGSKADKDLKSLTPLLVVSEGCGFL